MENRPKYEGVEAYCNEPLIENPQIKKRYEALIKKLHKEKMLLGDDLKAFVEIGVCVQGSYLYVISSNSFDYLKIGVAKQVFTRLSNLQVGNPFDLALEVIVIQKKRL